MFLPREFWKLSFLWFFQLSSRTPTGKRGLFKNSLAVALLSFSIGLAALSLTFALVSGFEDVLGRAVQSSGGHVIHVLRRWSNFEQLSKWASQSPESVNRAEFYWATQGLLIGKSAGRGVMIEGRREWTREKGIVKALPDDRVHIQLGKPLAQILGVQVGDDVRLRLPGVINGSVVVRVTALLSHGIFEVDSRMAILEEQSLRNYLEKNDPQTLKDRPGDARGIRFFLDQDIYPPQNQNALKNWIQKYRENLGEDAKDETTHLFLDWKSSKASLFQGISYNKKELSLIMSLLGLVSALNIAATLVVLFLLRDREIAILNALGMGPRATRHWIFVQGFILGVLASTGGLILGRILAWILGKTPLAKIPEDIYNIGVLPMKFQFTEQLGVFVFGVCASVLCAWILGFRLSKTKSLAVLGSRR